MLDWAHEARAAMERGPAAMVSVVDKKGSAPREVGTRMIVSQERFWGTIGGGKLEFLALEQARKMLALPPGSWRMQDYPLGPLLGQCCGGRVQLLVERLDAEACGWLEELRPGATLVTDLSGEAIARAVSEQAIADTPQDPQCDGQGPAAQSKPHWLVETLPEDRRPVLLFGAGHVGRAIMRAGEGLPLAFTWLDTRPEFCDLDDIACVTEDEAAAAAAAAGRDTAIAILTHDHGLDYRLTAAALNGKAEFVGLIGSRSKRARFLSRLAKDGVVAARLTCPIGLPGVPGNTPEAIAIAVLGQLLSLDASQ